MLKFVTDSIETYLEAWRLILVLGFIVFAILLFLTSFFTYVVAGAGFIRYSSLLGGEFDYVQLFILAVISLLSLFCLAFLSVGVTMIVKLKRSLDDIEFLKFIIRFPRYISRLMLWWIILGAITFIITISFNAIGAPTWISALAMLLLWAFFIFLPQSLVLHDTGFWDALKESSQYCMKRPGAVILYYLISSFLLFVLVCLEVIFGQFFLGDMSLTWIAVITNSLLLFIVFIPFLEIIKANVFVARYRLLTLGLK
ncbi:hypothetical protein K8R43_01025 [archaeon]|nr:hypothetical protein [archaeon]